MPMTGIDAEYLTIQAERCRRLARNTTDAAARRTLMEMAGEYEAMADQWRTANPDCPEEPSPAIG
jgi:hypothetical protein